MRKPRAFCDLVLRVTLHYLCSIPLVRSESLSPGHIREGGQYSPPREGRRIGDLVGDF